MKGITLDTETCGLHGPIVLLQWAQDDGPVQMLETWREPAQKVLETLEFLTTDRIIGFNLTFDWFHICQMYTTLKVYLDRWPTMKDHNIDPEMYAECEPLGRDLDCLKPPGACDVMISARNTKHQTLMDRKNIYIRNIPDALVDEVQQEMNRRLPFKPIYFARAKRMDTIWHVQESKREGFKNLYVRFAPSTKLKALASDALGIDTTELGMLDPPRSPLELGYAPFAKALQNMNRWKGSGKKWFKATEWRGSWVDRLEDFISYWGFYPPARKYAEDDVIYTRILAEEFGLFDDDATLACMVGAVRWRGFKVDLDQIQALRERAIKVRGSIPTDSRACMRWLAASMDETEALGLPECTDKAALLEIMQWDPGYEQLEEINKSKIGVDKRIELLATVEWEEEVSKRAHLILEARHAMKEIELYDKLLIAGRFHASFKVLGTLSSRMSGADGLNAQGIKKAKYVRKAFPLAFDGFTLSGGDFASFEVSIADAVYNDPKLHEILTGKTTCAFCEGEGCDRCDDTGEESIKVHAVFGTHFFPGKTYQDIRRSDGQVPDYYTISKSGFFAWLFAGTEHTLHQNLGIPRDIGREGIKSFEKSYPKVLEKRSEAMTKYAPIKQPDGLGTKPIWGEHEKAVSTLLGFSRRFDLELQVLKTLFDIVENPPPHWNKEGYIYRNERQQTILGAARSALLGAAFAIQGKMSRVAINQPIQGTGAQITKIVQRRLWDLQPPGYHPWVVIPMNIHDELMVPTTDPEAVALVVQSTVKEYTSVVPLLKMDWHEKLETWADK